jgi:phage terminase large subunit-like protein
MKQHPTTQYATDVVYGKIISCKWEVLACKRHLADLERVKNDLDFKFVFDESRANRIIDWFTICRHVRGIFAGQPIALDDWQKFDLGCIFGWVHKNTGKRRYKTAYIRVARGNAKSTLMSGIANYGMSADALYPPGHPELARYEVKPEVVCGAVDKEQAKIVWDDAREMALASPDILKRLKVQATKISHKTRGGELKKLSKDTKNKDGGAPCIIIIDEYHAHPTSLVKDITSSGKGKRSQCLELIITTAGEDAENKPCRVEDDIVKSILQGTFPNDTYFGVIREIDDDDDPHDERLWIKANPLFQNKNEYSNELFDTIKNEHDLAFGSGDNSKKRQWMIKRVNRWQVDAENKYFSGCLDKWKALGVSRSEFLELTHNRECYGGCDLSKCVDLTAAGFVFCLDDGRYAISAHGFIPENTAQKHEHGDRVPYKVWAKEGWCSLTEGDVTDDRFLKQYIHDMELDNKWKIKELCYDPYGARQFANIMNGDGYSCIETRQGVQTLSEPTKKFRELVLQDRIVHDGSPLLTWCLSNAIEVCDNNGNIKLSKKHKDDSQRIDLIAAVINAMTRAMINEDVSYVYENRGVRSLS